MVIEKFPSNDRKFFQFNFKEPLTDLRPPIHIRRHADGDVVSLQYRSDLDLFGFSGFEWCDNNLDGVVGWRRRPGDAMFAF